MNPPQRSHSPDRDPALDAAWKTHSTELPPPRLDAAILAAARREARTRPHAVGDDDGRAHARGPSRAWWGLAAAATIGAIAFGVLQLAPSLPSDTSTAVATDVPPATPERAPPATAPRDTPATLAEAQRLPGSDARSSTVAPAAPREDDRRSALARAPEPTRNAAPKANAQKAAEQERPRADAPKRELDTALASNAGALAEAPAAFASAPPSPQVAATAPRPFPGAAPAALVAAPPASPPVPMAPTELAKSEAASNAVDTRRRESGERMAAAPQAPAAEPAARRAQADAPAQGAVVEPAAKLRARTPAAWIDRLRTLHAKRRFDDAARELNAFRDAHPDADMRLPPELSAWAATVKREQ